jgi:AbrB family looped-hinge helix DNA binding protein
MARSKVTAHGRISVPPSVRTKLGIGPGSILEWAEDGDRIVVRRAGTFTSEDIHQALFGPGKLKSQTLPELKEGIRGHVRQNYARPDGGRQTAPAELGARNRRRTTDG